MKFHTTSIQAFTLIETIVSIGLLMVAVSGPLSVAIHSAAYTRDTKDQLVSTYLAQEAIEVLRFKRDSIFLSCANASSSLCVAQDIGTGYLETTSEESWRIFKNQLNGSTGGVSCFDSDGCQYDFYEIMNAPTTKPNLYDVSDGNCSVMYRDERKLRGTSSGGATDGMYLCKVNASGFISTKYTRVVTITSVPSVATSYDSNYNDDLRVDVVISYAQVNGMLKKVKVTDFIRPRV